MIKRGFTCETPIESPLDQEVTLTLARSLDRTAYGDVTSLAPSAPSQTS